MVDAFFLKFQMDKRKNAFSRGSRQGENRRKRLYFQGTVEMKQPQTITEPSWKGPVGIFACYGVMFIENMNAPQHGQAFFRNGVPSLLLQVLLGCAAQQATDVF